MAKDNKYGLDFNIAPKPSPKKDGDAKPAQPAPPAQKKQPNNGFGPETEKPKVPPPKEIKFLGAKFEPGQLDGFAPNKNCRVTGLAEFLCETNLTRCTLELFTVFDGKTQNTQINESKYGTASIEKTTGEFTFPTVPLYIPSGYPDYNTFSSAIQYKGIISATRHTEPLEFFIQFPDELVPKPIILKKGKFDTNGLTNYANLCDVNSPEYCKGTAVTALQKKLIELRYLNSKHIPGLFDETTEKALKKFQKDSLDLLRLSSLTKKLTHASMVTFKGTVNGECDDFTAQEIAQWQVESFLGPTVELYENDFDKEAVSQRIRPSGGDDFHEIGKPVVEAQKLLKAVGAYNGKEHGNFDKEMKNSLITFQNAAANGDLTDTNSNKVSLSKLQGHKIGIYDTPTQLFLQECTENNWKIVLLALGVRACSGPTSLKHDDKGTFKVTSFSRLPTADEKKKIHWSVNLNGKEIGKHENIGDVFEFHAIGKYVGETVTVHPYINKPSDNVKVTSTIGNYLVYDGSKLHWYDETLKSVKSWDATSGANGQVDPSKDDGPIPVGKWAVLYSKRDNISNKKEQKEFGSVRYEVFPFTETKTHDRKEFYIHGGKEAGTSHGIDMVDKIDSFADTIEKLGKDMVLVVKGNAEAEQCNDSKIDWVFISKMEGTKNDMYVPCSKDGTVLGVSGPTIASGFDLGQIDLAGLKCYAFDDQLEKKLSPYVSKKGTVAKDYVLKNPLKLSDSEISEINKKVKAKYAKAAEKFFNEELHKKRNFDELTAAEQTVFASVFFQYGTAKTLRSNLAANDIKAAIITILNFTTKTFEIEHETTKSKKHVMQYLERRCQEASYLTNSITVNKEKENAIKLVQEKEKEWEDAHGRKKFW